MKNKPVPKVDIVLFAGKWHSLYTIPGFWDRHWRQATHTYVIHPDGYYAVFTSYRSSGQEKIRYMRSKLFVVRGTGNAEMKIQFVWPFKIDYWVIELAEDYTYMVVGHPECKSLSIMSRNPEMEPEQLEAIIGRCAGKGYDTSQLVSQEHHPGVSSPLQRH